MDAKYKKGRRTDPRRLSRSQPGRSEIQQHAPHLPPYPAKDNREAEFRASPNPRRPARPRDVPPHRSRNAPEGA